ncbi:hypothetical protein CYMTET_47401 [Cymbomonas tetramitiformis]|uniref:Uncharacterized protein n=1 Tax=Cymbomonas tetramitiformis TaxID=36881 RepID=A0AAE0BW84_9CHLO|nr:hypothetical protein CYMTET_47401 [Cymbomonas tetramitiformis]
MRGGQVLVVGARGGLHAGRGAYMVGVQVACWGGAQVFQDAADEGQEAFAVVVVEMHGALVVLGAGGVATAVDYPRTQPREPPLAGTAGAPAGGGVDTRVVGCVPAGGDSMITAKAVHGTTTIHAVTVESNVPAEGRAIYPSAGDSAAADGGIETVCPYTGRRSTHVAGVLHDGEFTPSVQEFLGISVGMEAASLTGGAKLRLAVDGATDFGMVDSSAPRPVHMPPSVCVGTVCTFDLSSLSASARVAFQEAILGGGMAFNEPAQLRSPAVPVEFDTNYFYEVELPQQDMSAAVWFGYEEVD